MKVVKDVADETMAAVKPAIEKADENTEATARKVREKVHRR